MDERTIMMARDLPAQDTGCLVFQTRAIYVGNFGTESTDQCNSCGARAVYNIETISGNNRLIPGKMDSFG